MPETKSFALCTVLSVVTGRLLVPRVSATDNGIGDVYQLLSWLTADEVYSHQLGRCSEECTPWLLKWFPGLQVGLNELLPTLDKAIEENGPDAGCALWAEGLHARGLPLSFEIPRIPNAAYEQLDPVQQLKDRVGDAARIIVVRPTTE